MTDQLTPEDRLALSLVHRMMDSRRWGAKSRIFEEVAERQMREPGGVRVSYRTLADVLGIERRWSQRLLKAMVADHVLELVERGSGKRPSSYRVNPDVDTWKNAPLTVPIETAMWRLRGAGLGQARHLVRLFPELGIGPQHRGGGASLSNYLLRAQDPALAALLAEGQRGSNAPTNSEIGQVWEAISALAALMVEGQRGSPTPMVTDGPAPVEEVDLGGTPILSGSLRSPLERGGTVFDVEVGRLSKAIYTKTGIPPGRPLKLRLEQLLAAGCAEVGQLETWCRQAPSSFGPPLLVDLLEDMARTGGSDHPVTPQRSKDMVRRLIATYELEAPELVPGLLDELAALEEE